MHLLSLLLLLLPCTCVLAQTVLPDSVPPGPRQTATLIVDVQNEHYVTVLSTPYTHRVLRYVSRQSPRRSANRFRNFEWVDMRGRYDLRAIHRLQDSLHRVGWQLVDTDHTIATREGEMTVTYEERLVYTYSIPREAPPERTDVTLEGLEDYEQVRSARGPNVDGSMELMATLYNHPRGQDQSIVIQQRYDDDWVLRTRIDGLQVLPGGSADRIKRLEIVGLDLTFYVDTASGPRTYHFRQVNGQYRRRPLEDEEVPNTLLKDFRVGEEG